MKEFLTILAVVMIGLGVAKLIKFLVLKLMSKKKK